ncbi:MAG: LysR family transcriptional regulator [Methylocystaceae bacterium]|nr:LysR family transcriptional regulator [Methylocystaceae bacterium]
MERLPPLNALVSFCSAAKHQSFTKAAQELNLTHGAVSRAVKQLEHHFGMALFERRNRRVYLNEQGIFFYDKMQKILSDIQTAAEDLKQFNQYRKILISCEPSLAMRWLMSRLTTLQEVLGHTDIQILTAGGPVDLAAHSIDIAIRRADFKWSKEYWVTPLTPEWIGPVCNPSYLEKIPPHEWVALHTRTRPQAWSDWTSISFNEQKFATDQYFDHFYFSLQAAVAGMGVAIAPSQLVYDDLAQGALVAPFGFEKTDTEYVALTLKNPKSDEVLNDCLSWLMHESQKTASHF